MYHYKNLYALTFIFFQMDTNTKYNSINLISALLASIIPIYLSSLNQPLRIQVLPLSFLLIPFGLTIYKTSKEKDEIKDNKESEKAKTLKPILIKLDRVLTEQSIFSQTTYLETFLKNDVERLGWRKYFDIRDKTLRDRYYDFDRNLDLFIENPKVQKKALEYYFNKFYWLVSDYHKFYNSFSELTELINGFPHENKGYVNRLKTLEEYYDNYYTALKNLNDENEEIGSIFAGRYPLTEKPKKITFKESDG